MDQIFGGSLHKLMFLISLVFYSEKTQNCVFVGY